MEIIYILDSRYAEGKRKGEAGKSRTLVFTSVPAVGALLVGLYGVAEEPPQHKDVVAKRSGGWCHY